MRHSNMKKLLAVALLLIHHVGGFEVEECPDDCHCSLDGTLMLVDCSKLGLKEMPAFPDNQVHMLDLSNNEFTNIPPQLEAFSHLQYLDLSGNQISRLKPNSLSGLVALRMLDLSRNNISSWQAINPRFLFQPTVSLTELSLAENPLTSFSTNDDNLLIVSNSIRLLDLSHCKITKVTGQEILQGMKDLKHLNLAGNQIRSVSDMISGSLTSLDLSHNRLTSLQPTMLSNLPELTFIDLSRNHRISLQTKQGEYVLSATLRKINLSYCNMDNIELEGFPALTTAILRGNMIRELTSESFVNTKVLEILDLSKNSVNSVDSNTFKKLKHLKQLNLSFNLIPRIDRDTFKDNELLVKLDLSRNTISRFNRINAPNLTFLNMTWCQIVKVDPDAVAGLPEIVEIDLSNNLINDIPDSLASDSLLILDLSMNRMSGIKEATFAGFKEITLINLSGNRFTVPFRTEFFAENIFLKELHLGDNPWMCSCQDMYSFYVYVTDDPPKVWNKQSLRCQSPMDVEGRTWESACFFTWYPQSSMGTSEKVWTFFMVTVIAFSGCMCLIMSIKRGIEGRRRTRRELERERNLEEARDITRQQRLRMQQEAQLDAPDPRETRPPCYSDAIRMPRIDGSFASLDELNSRNKHKRRKKDNDDENDEIEEGVTLRRSRARSEEVLSMREIVSRSTRSPRIPPRLHPVGIEPHSPNSENPEGVHYASTNIMDLDHSPGASRARSPQNSLQQADIDGIRNFNQSTNTVDGSPYAKRKTKLAESSKDSELKKIGQPLIVTQKPSDTESIEIIDDHFVREEISSRDSFSSDTSSDFINIQARPQSTSSSSTDEGMVVIRKPSNV